MLANSSTMSATEAILPRLLYVVLQLSVSFISLTFFPSTVLCILQHVLIQMQIVAFLIPLLDDKFPLIRSITCWTLSRYSKFIVQVLRHSCC
jgi:hypothetical protein